MSAAEKVAEDLQEEEYEGVTHKTMESEKKMSSRKKTKKAPNSYLEAIALLSTYAKALEVHFSKANPLYGGVQTIWNALVAEQDMWKPGDTFGEFEGARMFWQLTKLAHWFLSATTWNVDGTAPTVDVRLVTDAIFTGSFLLVRDMSLDLVKRRQPDPIAAPSSVNPLVPSQVTHQNSSEKINTQVDPVIAALKPRWTYQTCYHCWIRTSCEPTSNHI